MKVSRLLTLSLIYVGAASLSLQPLQAQELEDPQAVRGDSKFTGIESPNVFEAMPDELITEEIDLEKLTEQERVIQTRNVRADELWKNADYRNYDKSFADLHRLSKAFTNNKYRLALSSYQTGVNTIIKMREKEELLRRRNRERAPLHEKWYWQLIDRKATEKRIIHTMQRKSKVEAVTYFTRAIYHLDDVLNKELREKADFKRLLSSVYRNWALYQFDLGNLSQCIPILELYMQIDENENEYHAHKYLSQCYAFRENMVKKYRHRTETELFRFRYKKNVHLLRGTELKYGRDSAEYKHVINLLSRDEIISIQN